MTEQSKTIAVVGASPFAWVLAGLLAADHSRAVVLLSPAPNPHGLRPMPSLSVAPVTRPQTWSLLSAHTRPTVRRLMRIAPNAAERVDINIGARSSEAVLALSHIHHTAAGFRFPVDPPSTSPAGTTLCLRDVWLFDTTRLLAAATSWLTSANVAVLGSVAGLKLKRDGSATFGTTTLDQVVLADDRAILDWLDPDEIAHFARVENWVGIETSPQRASRQRAGVDLDTGALFVQTAEGLIRAAGPDGDGSGMARIAALLRRSPAPRLAARTHFQRLFTHDGAPALGPTRRARLFVIAGLGVLDMVLAPLIAAIIAERANAIEAEWAAAHGAALRQPRREIADLAPGHLPGGAA